MIRVGCFGPVRARRVDDDGVETELDLGGPRQRAVLGVLAAAGPRVVSTDRLVEELYDGRPPAQAVAALQAFVSHLRRALEPERQRRAPARVLVSAAPGYRLQLPDDAVDTWHFSRLAAAVHAAGSPQEVLDLADRALALWVDVPWAGYVGSPWADVARDDLEQRRTTLTAARCEALLALGRPDRVLHDLAPHVTAHPLDEQAARLLALALYREERQAEALDLLARTRRALVDELGVDPGPALRELEAQVLAHDPVLLQPAGAIVAPPTEVAPGPRPEPHDDPVVGRDEELRRLRAALARRGVVWVEGEAGIGKSTLVDRACDEAVRTHEVVRGRCAEVAGAPAAWPWREVLRQLRPQQDADHDRAGHGAFDVAEALLAELRSRAGGAPVLVALDDTHRADEETLQVLRRLLTEAASAALVVVATFRPDEAGPELLGTRAALGALTLDHLRLTGLPAAAAEQLLARHAGGELPSRTRADLVGRAGGNPLYLRELGLVLGAHSAADAPDLPHAVRDLIARRLQRLAPLTETVLQHAAVLGRDVDVDALVLLLRRSGVCEEEATLDALDAAYVAGLLEQAGRDGLRFAHVLVRDTAYLAVPPLRRRRLHQVAGEVVASLRPDAVQQLAFHAEAGLDAASAPRAVDRLRRAGEELLADGSHRDAARLLAAAVAATDLLDPGDPLRAASPALHRSLVRAWAASGEWDRARTARVEAVAAAREWGTTTDLAAAWATGAPALTTPRPSLEDNTAEVAGIGEALATTDDPALRVELLVALVHELELGAPEAAVPAAREAETAARELGDPALECLALDAASFLVLADPAVGTGETERIGRRMLELATGAGLAAYRGLAHFHLHAAAVGRGDLDAAAEHIEEALRSGTVSQLGALLANARAFAGTRALVAGDVDGAAEGYAAAVTDIAAEGQPNPELITLWTECCTQLARGSLAPLLPRLRKAHAGAPDWMWHALLVCALLDDDRADEAAALPRPATAYPRNGTWLVTTCVEAYDAIRLGDLAGVRRTRGQLLPYAGTLARTANGALVLGPVDLTLAGCAAVLGDHDAVRRHQAAAAALARRMGSPHWEAEASADLSARL